MGQKGFAVGAVLALTGVAIISLAYIIPYTTRHLVNETTEYSKLPPEVTFLGFVLLIGGVVIAASYGLGVKVEPWGGFS